VNLCHDFTGASPGNFRPLVFFIGPVIETLQIILEYGFKIENVYANLKSSSVSDTRRTQHIFIARGLFKHGSFWIWVVLFVHANISE
jgi:hypothetical protein